MSKVNVQISRKNLYLSDYASAEKTVHIINQEEKSPRVAFEFLYRLFAEVVLCD